MVNHVTVFERPGLHEFLQKTSELADLILFTAGLEGMLACCYLSSSYKLNHFD
jgi:carboxy-terminal domain RNA polymerase II polypeptide A small phosphatase